MRVVFLGNTAWSVPSLSAIHQAADLEVELVITNPPRPAGRGAVLRPTPVADAARLHGLELAEVNGVRRASGRAALRAARPDMIAVVAYGEILSAEILEVPTQGAINLHFSLLPRWRGAAPVQHALLAGDRSTGVTTMLMEVGLDTGPILGQRTEPIRADDNAGTLGGRLATVGAALLVETLRSLKSISPRPQADEDATAAPRLSPEERILTWTDPAVSIDRRIRALAPEPGARTVFRGGQLGVLEAEATQEVGDPGVILGIDATGVVVAAGEGAIRLRSVTPAGRRHMSAVEWANGARFVRGERLG